MISVYLSSPSTVFPKPKPEDVATNQVHNPAALARIVACSDSVRIDATVKYADPEGIKVIRSRLIPGLDRDLVERQVVVELRGKLQVSADHFDSDSDWRTAVLVVRQSMGEEEEGRSKWMIDL